MAISVGTENGPHTIMCDMNTTPLIDVMLVLLVMLIVTIPIQTHAVKIDLPIGPGAPPIASAIDLEIDFDGTPIWNGTPVPSRARTLADAQRLGVTRIGFVGNERYSE